MPTPEEFRSRINKRLDQLPVLPTVIARLMVLDRDDGDYFEDLVELVESEPNFAVTLMGMSNSASSAPKSPITSAGAAIARLGSSATTDILTALSVTRVFVPKDPWEKSLWRHSVQVAVASRTLARAANIPELKPDEVYMAGLLHDLGRFVMFLEAPDHLRGIVESACGSPEELVEMERSICGIDHMEIASVACDRWSIPDSVAETARRHHDPIAEKPSSKPGSMARDIVHFVDLILFRSALGERPDTSEDAIAELFPQLPPWVKISAEKMKSLVLQALDEANATASALGV